MNFQYINGIKTFIPTSKKELIDNAIKDKKILFAINAEKIINSSKSDKNIISQNFGYPDGFGAVWELRKRGFNNAQKIPGCELWLEIVEQYYSRKSFYIIGSKQEVVERVVNKLKNKFEGIDIVNYRNGYFNSPKDYENLYKDIINTKPNIIFVAMGSPLQEQLIIKLQSIHQATFMGLGGSLDVYTGNVQRAPKFFIDLNLEWAFRLLREPKRLYRQFSLIQFFFKALLRRL